MPTSFPFARSPMDITRRQFVVTGLGLVASGCASTARMVDDLPSPIWPDGRRRPKPDGSNLHNSDEQTRISLPPRRAPKGTKSIGPLYAIPRDRWSAKPPTRRLLNPLDSIKLITVHHEGHKTPIYFTGWNQTSERMHTIQRWHQKDRGWADIGYHFVVDRAGRLWQGRDLRFQGAHVSHQNENNLGLMVLGNFDLQTPTRAQYVTLHDTLVRLMNYYRVPKYRVKTHQELARTACPGKVLQHHMMRLRRGRALA